MNDYDRRHFHSITIHSIIIRSFTIKIDIVIQFIVIKFVRQQILLETSFNTTFVKKSTSSTSIKEERDERNRNCFKDKFRKFEREDKIN